jgi:hypothetical protein
MRNAYKILVGIPEGMKPLGRCRRIWEDNIRMNLGNEWIVLRLTGSEWAPVAGIFNTVMKFLSSMKGEEFLGQLNEYQLLKEDSAPWN